jgi:hypothetical protein
MAQPQSVTSEAKKQEQHRHTSHYLHTCKACREADKARSASDKRALNDADLAHTTFLLPEDQYDNQVCREYLRLKYPDHDHQFLTSSINLEMLTGWEREDTIVVVRRVAPPHGFGPRYKRQKDEENKWADVEVHPSTYVGEVVESAPLLVDELVTRPKANRYVKASIDYRPLIERLTELLVPTYRVDMPREKNDSLMRVIRS